MHSALHPHILLYSVHRSLARSLYSQINIVLLLSFMNLRFASFFSATALCVVLCSAIGIISNMIKRIIFYQPHISAVLLQGRTYSTLFLPHAPAFYPSISHILFHSPPSHRYALLSHMCLEKENATT